MDMIVNGVNTICGHTFCEKCISESLLLKQECPLCREDMINSELVQCKSLGKLLKEKQKNMKYTNSQEEEANKKRIEEEEKWQHDKSIGQFELGQEIDVQDTELIWCKGQGWSNVYDEYININSKRLAPKGFYTERKDVQRYVYTSDNMLQTTIMEENIEEEEQEVEQLNEIHIDRIIQQFNPGIGFALRQIRRFLQRDNNNQQNDNNSN